MRASNPPAARQPRWPPRTVERRKRRTKATTAAAPAASAANDLAVVPATSVAASEARATERGSACSFAWKRAACAALAALSA
eukprot:scaffold110355_cov31-Tisochrysis_lutea.AAC.3